MGKHIMLLPKGCTGIKANKRSKGTPNWVNDSGFKCEGSRQHATQLQVSSLQLASVFVFLYKRVHRIFLKKQTRNMTVLSLFFVKMFSKFTLITRLCIFLSCATLRCPCIYF